MACLTEHGRDRHPSWRWLAAAAVWIVLIASGMATMVAYGGRAGESARGVDRWPEALGDKPEGWTLAIAVHPRCPCTAATLEEIERLAASSPAPFAVMAFVFEPAEDREGAGWPDETPTTRKLGRALDADLIPDPGGRLSAQIGGFTSGHAALFDASGRARFRGGLTPRRAHTGPNTGAASVRALLAGEEPVSDRSPVFGCPLRRADGCGESCAIGARTGEIVR